MHLACFSYHTHVITILMLVISGITPNVINSIDPAVINVFPNYLWVYLHHLITFQVLGICGITIYLRKYEQLRRNVNQVSIQ